MEELRRLIIGYQSPARYRVGKIETETHTAVPAIRFYRSVGFQVEGIDLSYYTNMDVTDFEVAIFMKRKITT